MNRLSRILVELALEEDLREAGDITAEAFIPADLRGAARFVSRERAVVSGLEPVAQACRSLDPSLQLLPALADGSAVEPGGTIAEIRGPARSILAVERTALNFLQRLSGVATTARAYAERIAHTSARVLDTRKTTPGWRELEKAAVRHGGGTNHRRGLHDAVLVKDNHLAALPDAAAFAERVAEIKTRHPDRPVEVEADTLEQVEAFLSIPGVDAILLDNMAPDQLAAAVALRGRIRPACTLEASGGITLETVAAVAETGVDFISVGALTHSVRAVDISLDYSESRDDDPREKPLQRT